MGKDGTPRFVFEETPEFWYLRDRREATSPRVAIIWRVISGGWHGEMRGSGRTFDSLVEAQQYVLHRASTEFRRLP